MRVSDLLQAARQALAKSPASGSGREVHLLMMKVLGTSEAELLAHPERSLDEAQRADFDRMLQRRLRSEPMAYILGEREFWGRSFQVDSRVLIPRPETEHLVEIALALQPTPRRILDLCTGSGCIAISLALDLPGTQVFASDRSVAALAVAQGNARRHRATVGFSANHWFDGLDLQGFDLVVCNPPYVELSYRDQMTPEVRDYEPPAALFAGQRGLDAYRSILRRCDSLGNGCRLVLELGAGQREDVEAMANDYGLGRRHVELDYSGWERILVLEKSADQGES